MGSLARIDVQTRDATVHSTFETGGLGRRKDGNKRTPGSLPGNELYGRDADGAGLSGPAGRGLEGLEDSPGRW